MKFFDFSKLKGDLAGGITAGVVALPLALAFGVQSGLGASAGLYGAIFLGFFASLFGGTPSQVSGPTGPMTVITASMMAMAAGSATSAEAALGFVLFTFLLAGAFQIVFGLIHLGKYIKYIPYPVLSGFMSGIGIIIILLQLYPLLGAKSPASIVEVFSGLPALSSAVNIQAAIIALLTLAVIYLFPFVTRKIPATLVALVVASLISAWKFGGMMPLIGDIPQSLPKLQAGLFFSMDFDMILMAVIPALSLAGLGAIDTLLTSVVADNITKTRHQSNRELIGQGIGNMAASIFGGIPGAGATMRTVINVRTGGRTKISGMVHSLFLLAVMLGLGSLVSWIPLSALAAVLISVGISIIDRKGLRDLIHIPRADAVVLIIVLLMTVFVDLLQAVGIGMVIASVLFMKRASDLVESGTLTAPMTLDDKEIPWEDEGDITPEMLERIYIQRLDGPVFFGAVARFQQQMSKVPAHASYVIIRMRKVPFMDMSGVYALEEAVLDLQKKNITVLLTIVQPQPMYLLKKVNLVPGLIPDDHVFPTFEDCARWLKQELAV